MKKLYSFVIETISRITTVWTLILFKLMGVQHGKNFLCQGFLRIRSRGNIHIGDGVMINSSHNSSPVGANLFTSITVNADAKLSICDNTGISNTYIYCREEIIIGKNVLIGGGCQIYDTDFHSLDYKRRTSVGDKGNSRKVCIENNVFIGANSIVLKGSIISENSIVGAGSVVRGYIPPNEIWCGNPAVFVKRTLNVE